ncbi:MAG: insulinase family protein [Candidatus Eisenbacteria bacterium]|nr:insulinase family protein [Candidatus Eisenbacteria bacterium]
MKFRGLTLCLAVLGLLARSHATAGDPSLVPASARMFRLANGLSVLLAPDTLTATVDVALWFPAGARFERAGRTGLTHLFDGLLFAGTPGHPAGEHQRLIQRVGGTLGVLSTPDFTYLTENVPPAALELALALEADRMAHLNLNAGTLEPARAVMRREHEGGPEGGALGQGLRRLYEVVFAGHPYRWPSTGVPSDLANITLADCRAFYHDHYGPDGALLTLAGRFDPAAAETLVRRTLGALPRRPVVRAEPAPVKPQTLERRASGATLAQVPLMLIGWRTPPDRDPDAAALDVIDHVITHGTRSSLDRTLTAGESGCLAASGGLDLRRDAGLFYVAAAIRPDADTAAVEREVLAQIQTLIGHASDPAVFEAAQRQTEVETLFGWQTTQGFGRALGTAVCVDGAASGAARRLEHVRQLTPATLREAAERTFAARNRSVVWLRPGPQPPTERPARSPTTKAAAAHSRGGR